MVKEEDLKSLYSEKKGCVRSDYYLRNNYYGNKPEMSKNMSTQLKNSDTDGVGFFMINVEYINNILTEMMKISQKNVNFYFNRYICVRSLESNTHGKVMCRNERGL